MDYEATLDLEKPQPSPSNVLLPLARHTVRPAIQRRARMRAAVTADLRNCGA